MTGEVFQGFFLWSWTTEDELFLQKTVSCKICTTHPKDHGEREALLCAVCNSGIPISLGERSHWQCDCRAGGWGTQPLPWCRGWHWNHNLVTQGRGRGSPGSLVLQSTPSQRTITSTAWFTSTNTTLDAKRILCFRFRRPSMPYIFLVVRVGFGILRCLNSLCVFFSELYLYTFGLYSLH